MIYAFCFTLKLKIFVLFTFRLEHLRLHEKHKGHEEMHAEMVLILFTVTLFAQIGLVAWKKHHYKSYQVSWNAHFT